MFRSVTLSIFYLLLTTELALAGTMTDQSLTLKLNCNIAFVNYDSISDATKSVEIALSAEKNKPGGMYLVSQTDDYEFWVMTHGIQTMGEQKAIVNFQVAIKHKASQLFMHALSDTSYIPGKKPHHARISLVNYHPDSQLESGELFFECRHFE